MKPVKMVITTGDTDGIGLEVAVKALDSIDTYERPVHFLLMRSKDSSPQWSNNKIPVKTVDTSKLFVDSTSTETVIFDLPENSSPVDWFTDAIKMAMSGKIHGIITAPMSKTLIAKKGFREIGHTELLATHTGNDSLFMVFLGDNFNVLLATGHIPLSSVPKKLDQGLVGKAIEAALDLKKRMGWEKPIGVLGLNPHCGEDELIGNEETIIKEVIGNYPDVIGPLVPDAAFLPQNWDSYSLFISLYHDQGLIPFKMIHGHDSGVHLTYGIDFIRTSVDHGTAKELFGKNRANPASMTEAILTAVRLCPNPSEEN